ncbi:MAG: nitronate monooxygenase, partial [Gemmataceae bacterium]
MHQSDVIALGPAGWFDAGVTIAASRCGARGFADLEFVSESQARGILQDLARHATTPFGIKVGPESSAILPALLGWAGEKLGAVLLAGGDSARWSDCMQTLRQQGVEILWEAVRVAEALRGCELGVDALVLKGQEAGGRVGEEPTFILLQRWLRERGDHALPFYVQGGVGCHTATACMLAGARGVVLDNQLLLTRESPVSRELQQRLATADGSETLLVGESLGSPYRVYTRPGLASVQELLAEESRIAASKLDQTEKHEAWRQTIHRLALAGPEQGPWFLGQDIALAAPLAARSGTIASLIDHLLETGRENRKTARTLRPFAEGSPLAQQLGTRYPILQGPMTRVSDTAAFADAVAREGGLPFLALALLRQAETEKLLEETKSLLGEKSWGAG